MLPCNADHCCVSQALWLSRTNDCFSHLAAWTALPNTVRINPWAGDFQVGSSSIFPSPVSEVCGIFSNRFILSGDGRQPRAPSLAYDVKVAQIPPSKACKKAPMTNSGPFVGWFPHFIHQAGFKHLVIVPLLPSECWNHKFVSPCQD